MREDGEACEQLASCLNKASGQGVDADGGMGHLALGAKLEHNLTRSWKSLAARRAAVRQSPPAHPWFSPYRAAKAEKAIATGAADGTILSLLKG